jgi:hypothetical protein
MDATIGNVSIKVDDIISHSELKKYSLDSVVVLFVCSPKEGNNTMVS